MKFSEPFFGLIVAAGSGVWLLDFRNNSFNKLADSFEDYTKKKIPLRGGGLAVGLDGSLFIADSENNQVLKMPPWTVPGAKFTTYAGSGNRATIDGEGIFSAFDRPRVLAMNSVGVLFVFQISHLRIIDQSMKVSTFREPVPYVTAAAFDAQDNLLIASESGLTKYDRTLSVKQFIKLPMRGLATRGTTVFASGFDHKIYKVEFPETAPPKPEPSPVSLQINFVPVITISGKAGGRYQIEASNVSTGPWNPVTTLSTIGPTARWVDETATNRNRFYRAVALP
jgi:hypothetical protein